MSYRIVIYKTKYPFGNRVSWIRLTAAEKEPYRHFGNTPPKIVIGSRDAYICEVYKVDTEFRTEYLLAFEENLSSNSVSKYITCKDLHIAKVLVELTITNMGYSIDNSVISR